MKPRSVLSSHRLRAAGLGALAAALLLSGCVSMPTGPSVATFPGSQRTFDQFRVDEADCRRYAMDSIGGSDPSRAQADSAFKSAAIGTAVGALAGAALGGSHGAATGAGVGLLFGGVAGAEAANASGSIAQRRYDTAFVQCMYAKGHRVPSTGLARSAAPVPVSRPAPPVYYPPPPPAYAPPPAAVTPPAPTSGPYGPPAGYDPRHPPPPPPPGHRY